MMIKTGNLIIISIKTTVESIYIYIAQLLKYEIAYCIVEKSLVKRFTSKKAFFIFYLLYFSWK